MPTRTATARYQGFGKKGAGTVSTGSGILQETSYGFGSRFEEQRGTNPEELIAAAPARRFTMALSFALEREGFTDGTLETNATDVLAQQGDGVSGTRSDMELLAPVPGIEEPDFAEIS